MEDLKEKIVGLLSLLGGARDLPFLAMAFADAPRGDIAIAVLELCAGGKLVADSTGIHLAEAASEEGGEEPASAEESKQDELADAEEPEQGSPADDFGEALSEEPSVVCGESDERKVFADMIASHARFTLGLDSFLPEVVASDSFKAELRRAERAFSVVEVRKDEYWGSSNFEKLGNPLTPDDFRAYLNKVIDRAQPRHPFTVASLRRAGLTRTLDDAAREAGLGDYFIESVLSIGYVGGRLKRTSMAGTTVFCVMSGTFDAPGMLNMLMGDSRSMSVSEMVHVLNDDLGIRTIPAVVKQLVRRSLALRLDDATGAIVRAGAGDREGW